MPEVSPPPLNPAQVARLESLLNAGFRFVTFEQFGRYPGVEKAGFVALIDLAEDGVRLLGGVGLHMGSGIGVLIERAGGKAFVLKNELVEATPERLAAYEDVKRELNSLLQGA